MKKNKAMILVIALVAITAVAAFMHLSTREDVPGNGIQVVVGNEATILDMNKLEYETVTGTYVTGKGEEREVNDPGISLENLLREAEVTEYTKVIVTADDSYCVEVAADEEAEAYLIKEEDSLRLIVFSDKDSKRNVKNVVRIEVIKLDVSEKEETMDSEKEKIQIEGQTLENGMKESSEIISNEKKS